MKNFRFPVQIVFLSLLFCTTLFAQPMQVEVKVRSYSKISTVQDLSKQIMENYVLPRERAHAAYAWIAQHISYDLEEFSRGNNIAFRYSSAADKEAKEREYRQNLVARTLKSRKAVCEGYATLFREVCREMGLESEIVSGTSRSHFSQIGTIPQVSDHAWNAVKIGAEWFLVDVTWGAGAVDGASKQFKKGYTDAYFMPTPERFFLNHFPKDRQWLLVDKSAEDFALQPFFYPAYITSAFQIMPAHGSLAVKSGNPVKLKIENLSQADRVAYVSGKNNTLEFLAVQSGVLTIPSEKLGGHLTLFVNEKPIVSYKILRG
jgi:transglutaminase/protease-like cytokinesis protein 3